VTALDGWVALSFMAGEVKNPNRNLLGAVALGLGAVIAIYVFANMAYLRVLSVSEIAGSERVGALAAERMMGAGGGKFVAAAILMSIIGGLNGWSMAAPRIYFAQARDGLFFRSFARIHPRFETPYISIVMFGAWSALLAVTGTYETLAAYAMFAAWVFYALTTLGVVVLRRTQPDRPRPYRMAGYPVTLALFALVAIGFVINTFFATPGPAIVGTLFIASGVPVYFWWKRNP
jgi:APA family basic amino acid/polyamine antiporter